MGLIAWVGMTPKAHVLKAWSPACCGTFKRWGLAGGLRSLRTLPRLERHWGPWSLPLFSF
jgi:hypothetical protein